MRKTSVLRSSFICAASVIALTASHVSAQCDGWQALGSGMDLAVRALTVYNGDLIAGGSFFTAGGTVVSNIARWDDTSWNAMGPGIDATVFALTVYNGELIAGGAFYGFPSPAPGCLYGEHVAAWNGTAWHSLGGGVGFPVRALAIYNGELIAAGESNVSSGPGCGTITTHVARWNGSEWRPLGNGLNFDVVTLTVWNGELIAGGWFWMSGTEPTASIAHWNGAEWKELGFGTNGVVEAMASFHGALVVGGSFTTAGGNPFPLIAAWHGGPGNSWTELGTGVDNLVYAIGAFREELIVGGEFSIAGSQSANHVASWSGGGWSPMGSGMNERVDAITMYNGDIIAGGGFTTADGLPRNRIARWKRCYRCTGDLGEDDTVGVPDLLNIINHWGPCPAPCPSDITDDGAVGVPDLLTVINSWGPCPTGACWLPDNTCVVNTRKACFALKGLGWVEDATCVDGDSDRIPDAFELDDCSTPALPFVGSDPAVADTDEDGINDGDEFLGTTAGLKLPDMGCNPLRREILIEADWVRHTAPLPAQPIGYNKPHANQIARVQDVFLDSPVDNHCWGTGVTILVDYGQGGLFNGGNEINWATTAMVPDPGGAYPIGVVNTSSPGVNGELQTIKTANFDVAKRKNYFHYMVVCDAIALGGTYVAWSGISEIGGNDFVVSYGQWGNGDNDDIGNTIMHELGHNLGLRHGGDENLNWKPNYNSVMNYRFQLGGIDSNCDAAPDGMLNYSTGGRPEIDELNLDEAAGVCGLDGGVPIDWDGNSVIENPIPRNINCPAGITYPWGQGGPVADGCTNPDDCFDCVLLSLHDYNDWNSIVFDGLTAGENDFAPLEIAICEMHPHKPRAKIKP